MRDITDVENVILKLPEDQQRAVANVLTLVAGQVEAARDDAQGGRWGGLSEGAHIVGCVAAFARGVVGQ